MKTQLSTCMVCMITAGLAGSSDENMQESQNKEENITEEKVTAEVTPITDIRSVIASDWENDRFLDKVLAYEEQYAASRYRGNKEAERPYAYKKSSGESRILITAPHAVYHIRENEPKAAEIYTGALAHLLQEYTGVHILTAIKETDDPAYQKKSAFKNKMGEIIEAENIDLVIDLHGASKSHEFTIDIGTDEGAHIDAQEPEFLQAYAAMHGMDEVVKNHTFSASSPETIAAFSRHELNTPAMQLEIHGDYRNPRNDIEAFYQLVNALSEYLYAAEQKHKL